jgi:hypothetical protein
MARSTGTGGAAPSKTCASCGRRIEWRKKWARDWEQVRYCSAACRRRGVTSTDRELEEVILRLLRARAHSATICPSDAARAAAGAGHGVEGGDAGSEAWRELMEPVRRAARRLVAQGSVQVTQQGQVVDPSTARGAIRIRLRR